MRSPRTLDVPTPSAYNVGMDRKQKKQTVQLTVRNVPAQVKARLSSRASAQKKSLNEVLVDALSAAAGVDVLFTDLNELAGRWVEDPSFDEAIRLQGIIDEEAWK